MAKSDKEVVTTSANLPALTSMYEEDVGAGFENADRDSYSIPFINILQSGSPQVKKSDGAFIKGAEEGFLYNSVSQEVVNGEAGLYVIPCYFTRRFVEWLPRDAGGGGGLAGEHLPSDNIVVNCQRNDKNQMVTANGNSLVDTRTHYCLIVNRESGLFTPALISMSSTQVKKSRQWMTRMESIKFKNAQGALFTPPMFSHMYHLTTIPEQNDQGSWYGWRIETAGPVEDTGLYSAAKSFRDAVKSGEAKPAALAAETDKDIPF